MIGSLSAMGCRGSRVALGLLLSGLLSLACGPAVGVDDTDRGGTTIAPGTGEETEAATQPDEGSTEQGGPSQSGTSQPGSGTEGEPGPPQPEALGCQVPVSCDKGTYEGSPVLATPQDVAELSGYTEITGRLDISNSDFDCLSFLACLESVGHDLTLVNNAQLTDVTGLDHIQVIGAQPDGPRGQGGTLTISGNAALLDFNTLGLLDQAPVSLRIVGNDSLQAISGLQGMVGTREDVEIRLNPVLEDIPASGLPELLFIGGECVVSDNERLSAATAEEICKTSCQIGRAHV